MLTGYGRGTLIGGSGRDEFAVNAHAWFASDRRLIVPDFVRGEGYRGADLGDG